MNHEMVLSALGQPRSKMRELENQQDIEIWIYGQPPDPTQFVRFNGNRVIRLEIAKVGQPIEVHAKNEMGDYWSTQQPDNARIVKLGDQSPADADKQTVRPAPTLRNPGETLPVDKDSNTPQMRPVEFPKDSSGSQQGTGTQQGQAPTPSQQVPAQPSGSQLPASQPAPNQSQQLVASATTQ
jgi:hypothetical protein